MSAAVGAIICVWAVLLGIAYLARRVLDMNRRLASGAVVLGYLCFCALAFLELGAGWQWWAGSPS